MSKNSVPQTVKSRTTRKESNRQKNFLKNKKEENYESSTIPPRPISRDSYWKCYDFSGSRER